MGTWIPPAVLADLLRLGGLATLGVAAANLPAAKVLRYGTNLAAAPLFFRQVVYAHLGWVVASLVLFGTTDLLFAEALAGGHPLGTYLSAWLALLWGVRFVLQVGVYDPALRRAHPIADRCFVVLFALLALVHLAAVALATS